MSVLTPTLQRWTSIPIHRFCRATGYQEFKILSELLSRRSRSRPRSGDGSEASLWCDFRRYLDAPGPGLVDRQQFAQGNRSAGKPGNCRTHRLNVRPGPGKYWTGPFSLAPGCCTCMPCLSRYPASRASIGINREICGKCVSASQENRFAMTHFGSVAIFCYRCPCGFIVHRTFNKAHLT